MDGSNNSEEFSPASPKIYCTLPPLLLKQNHPASIPIKVTGRPTPKLEWLVKGVSADQCPGCRVSTGPGRRSHPDEILTVLEISSVDQTLEGGIELVAVNDQGTDRFVVPLKTYRRW